MAMVYALDAVNEEVKAGRRKYALDGLLYDTCSNGIAAVDTVIDVMSGAERESVLGRNKRKSLYGLELKANA